MSLSAYQRARTLVETPRATEQRLIRAVTAALIEARDQGYSGGRLMEALHWNREMWDTFASACGAPGNGLPDTLRASIISIALWVNRHASEVMVQIISSFNQLGLRVVALGEQDPVLHIALRRDNDDQQTLFRQTQKLDVTKH